MPRKRTAPNQQPEYVRAYRREYYRRADGLKFIRSWRERHPEKRAEYRDDWKGNNREKVRAHDRVWAEIHAGRMKPARELSCVDCGQPAQEYDHHLGYEPEHWLDVEPLCRPCHGKRRWKQ